MTGAEAAPQGRTACFGTLLLLRREVAALTTPHAEWRPAVADVRPCDMRVLLLTSSSGVGGATASLEKIARGLTDRGVDVQAAATVPRLAERLSGAGLRVTQLPEASAGSHQVSALLAAMRRLRPQVILLDTPRDVRLAAYATLLYRIPVVYRYSLNHRRPHPRLMDRTYLRRVAAVIYQSRWVREQALTHDPWLVRKPSWLVPNGYDTTRYAPDREAGARFRDEYGVPPNTFVVLTVGRLVRHKGQEVAMAALDRLRRGGARVLYLICGDGTREAELRAFAESLQLPTVFTGLLEPEGVVAALAAADLVVHPSLREIFPNAVGEAMACGCPVVAVDGGGTREVLGMDGLAGLLVPPDDPDVMALAIGSLIEDPGRRAEMGQAARHRIVTEFPLARMVDGYERALGEVIRK